MAPLCSRRTHSYPIDMERHIKHGWLPGLAALLIGGVVTLSAQDAGVSFIGFGVIPSTALDKSGLAGKQICQRDNSSVCIDQATLGGLGSGVTYSGFGNIFLAVPDRGPFDGRTDVPFLDRYHFLNITLTPGAFSDTVPNIKPVLLDTTILRNEFAQPLVGDAYAFDTQHPALTRRFDPEAIAVSPLGTFYISDEYGPYIREFTRSGRLLRRIAVPAKFALDPVVGNLSGDLDGNGDSVELSTNVTGRQANRGMEGLAITPNDRSLVGIMQNALLQDHGVEIDSTNKVNRVGLNNRILTVDLLTGRTHEYVYVMDAINQGRGVNDLLAINDHEFLVLERDNRTKHPADPTAAPSSPNLKRLYKIDLAKPGLTDVSGIPSLPKEAIAKTGTLVDGTLVVPVDKTLVVDLLDASYKVNATDTIKDIVSEKIEGLAWGPDMKDGRHVLYVFSDNDLSANPTQIYAFAIDGAVASVNVKRQAVLLPVFNIFDLLKWSH